jgi:hypothetical protein
VLGEREVMGLIRCNGSGKLGWRNRERGSISRSVEFVAYTLTYRIERMRVQMKSLQFISNMLYNAWCHIIYSSNKTKHFIPQPH